MKTDSISKTMVVGIAHKEGTFEKDGKKYPYDNILVHCVLPDGQPDSIGNLTQIYKLKKADFDKCPVGVGDYIADVYFDRYGNAVFLRKEE